MSKVMWIPIGIVILMGIYGLTQLVRDIRDEIRDGRKK